MELFLPSTFVIVLSALVCFFIIPRASPYILAFLCTAMLLLGLWQHYSMFPYEYPNMEFKDFAGYIFLIGIIIAGLIASTFMNGGTNSANTTSSSILPEMKMPSLFTGANSKSIMGQSSNSGFGGNISKTVSGFSEGASNALSSLTNQVSGLMKTPVSTNLASGSFKVT
jgi:predicted PurR-regulated permease PerM